MRLIDRKQELAFLDQLENYSDSQMILMYGRRRVGKTVLLRQWAEKSVLRHVYWAAEKEPPALQRRKFFATCFGNIAPQAQFETWADCFAAIAQILGQEHTIIIIDELPYAADADNGFLSALQHAWDHLFKPLKLILVLCGSHVNVMERLMNRQSPVQMSFGVYGYERNALCVNRLIWNMRYLCISWTIDTSKIDQRCTPGV